MKMKNRKGSTLVLSLIVFAVLIIFGTFLLGFMVNENKMSLNHQGKIQAYYIARAGAEAVEAAIIYELDDDEKSILIDLNEGQSKEIQVEIPQIGKVPVKIVRTSSTLEIISTGEVDNNIETVTKILNIIPGEYVKVNYNFIVMSKKSDENNHIPPYLIEDKDIVFNVDESIYKEYDFGSLENVHKFPALPKGNTWGIEGEESNYYIEDDLKLDGRKINVLGKVNIFVNGSVELKSGKSSSNGSTLWSTNEEKDNLNIFILPKENDNDDRLIYMADHNQPPAEKFSSNIYLASGNANISLKKATFNCNIISNGNEVYFHTQTGGKDHNPVFGNIYAPNATVQMDINSLSLNGFVVSNYLKLHHQNGKGDPGQGKLILLEGIQQDLVRQDKHSISPGYYK